MVLREADAIDVLRQSMRLKQTLTEGDCNAVIKDGSGFILLPVWFRVVNGKQELFVEYEDQWYNPRTLSGFVRLERMPEEIAFEQAAASTSDRPVAANWLESRQFAEAEAKRNLTARQNVHRESNGVGISSNKWQTFSDAAYRARNNK
jgi:hypothetical protein